jgi:hypothetical protein
LTFIKIYDKVRYKLKKGGIKAMKEKYFYLDTGSYFMQVVKVLSDDDIEVSHDTLEKIASECLKNNIHFSYYKDIDLSDDIFNEYDEIEGFTYLDLSCYDIDFNIYMEVNNFKMFDTIPTHLEYETITI